MSDSSEKIRRLQILLSRYGDRIRMANSSEWQEEIDEALAIGAGTHDDTQLSDHLSSLVDLESPSFHRIIIPFEKFKEWIDLRSSGKWSWIKNTLCKYVTIGIDARSGVYSIKDRDGKKITFERLMWQYSKDNPEPPE